MAKVEKENNQVGIKPEAIEVTIEEGSSIKTDPDFVTLKEVKAHSKAVKGAKARKSRVISEAVKQSKKKEAEQAARAAEKVMQASSKIEDAKVVGTTKDGETIYEAEIVSETSKTETEKDAPAEEQTDDSRTLAKTGTGIDMEFFAKFRDEQKNYLSMMVKASVEAKSFKSKVYGGLVQEWADATADFIERVVMVTLDIKWIKAYSEVFKTFSESKDPLKDILNTEEADGIAPFDVDVTLFNTTASRASEATLKMYTKLDEVTFSTDAIDERIKAFFKLAKENTLQLMLDGPKGCEIGFRDLDGNIYDQYKKPFVPKAEETKEDEEEKTTVA